MKSGVYRVNVDTDHLIGSFSLYSGLDPNPFKALETFASIFTNTSSSALIRDRNILDKAVIGDYSRQTQLERPIKKSNIDFC